MKEFPAQYWFHGILWCLGFGRPGIKRRLWVHFNFSSWLYSAITQNLQITFLNIFSSTVRRNLTTKLAEMSMEVRERLPRPARPRGLRSSHRSAALGLQLLKLMLKRSFITPNFLSPRLKRMSFGTSHHWKQGTHYSVDDFPRFDQQTRERIQEKSGKRISGSKYYETINLL